MQGGETEEFFVPGGFSVTTEASVMVRREVMLCSVAPNHASFACTDRA
jgi:hypothetical protein